MKQIIGMITLGLVGLAVGITLLVTAEGPFQEGGRGFPYIAGILAGIGGGVALIIMGFVRLSKK